MDFPSDYYTGIPRSRFYAEPPDFDKITDSWEYADGGKDFNEVADNPPRRWEYEYILISATNTDPASAAQFDTFYNTVRKSTPFNFLDKYGDVWNNVYVEDYSRTHQAHKPWVVFIKFKLVGYNSTIIDHIDLGGGEILHGMLTVGGDYLTVGGDYLVI
jgi:hypothetical protein